MRSPRPARIFCSDGNMGCGLLGMYHIIYKKGLLVYNMIQNIF